MWVEPQARPALGRPIYIIEPALNITSRDGTKIPAVGALAAIVAQKETVSVGHGDLGHVRVKKFPSGFVCPARVFPRPLIRTCPGLEGSGTGYQGIGCKTFH